MESRTYGFVNVVVLAVTALKMLLDEGAEAEEGVGRCRWLWYKKHS